MHRDGSHRDASRRQGSTLVELLIALPLMALLGAVALMLMLAAQRSAQRTDRSLANVQELRQAGAALASELRPLAATDIVAATDTSIEFDALVGTGFACNGLDVADRVELLSELPDEPLRTNWVSPPQPDDIVRVWLATSLATASLAPPTPYLATVRTTSLGRACTSSPLVDSSSAPAAVTRTLRLRSALPSALAAGAPVRITRRVRYALYQSGAEWFLGRRERSSTGWDVIQPVAGPLQSPTARGLFIQLRDGDERSTAAADTTARSVHIELRAPSRIAAAPYAARTTVTDSVLIDVALRASLTVTPPARYARIP